MNANQRQRRKTSIKRGQLKEGATFVREKPRHSIPRRSKKEKKKEAFEENCTVGGALGSILRVDQSTGTFEKCS